MRSLGVGTPTSTVQGEIRASDNITAYYTSDARLKENVRDINNALEKILSIRGVIFDWTEAEVKRRGGLDNYFVRKDNIGVIAQEIEKIVPEVVGTRHDGTKAVKYELLVPLIVEAIKELNAKIEK